MLESGKPSFFSKKSGDIMIIKDGNIVSMHYSLKNKTGEVINASTDGEPLVFKYGTGAIIPGLEKDLAGKSAGEEFSVEVKPEEGYGEVNPALFAVLKREAFTGIDDIKPGMQFEAQDENGNSQIITVKSVKDEEITVDRNHPLAGETLYFDINIVSVKADSDE